MSQQRHVALVPRDGFFAKDGRGWHTSSSGRGHGLDWPWPSTVLGAIRTAWGRDEESRTGTTFSREDWRTRTAPIQLGRTLALRRKPGSAWQRQDIAWPVPMDALWFDEKREVSRLEPRPPLAPTLGRDTDAAREGLWRPVAEDANKPRPAPRWWSDGDNTAWLAGEAVQQRTDVLRTTRRLQVHVGIRDEEATADPGILFSHDVVETLELGAEWALGTEVTLPAGDLPDSVTLGSDSRLARVEELPEELFEAPAGVVAAFQRPCAGLRLVTVTPLCFNRGWLPDGFTESGGEYRGRLPGLPQELVLRAALVPRPVHVSGWDMVRGVPKPTSRMVPPGAVYFFELADGTSLTEEVTDSMWLAALGARTDEGFGRVVPGVWRPLRNHL